LFLFARSDFDLRVARPDAVHAFGAAAVFEHGFEHNGQAFAFNHRLLIDLQIELLAQSNHFRLPRLLCEQRGEESKESKDGKKGIGSGEPGMMMANPFPYPHSTLSIPHSPFPIHIYHLPTFSSTRVSNSAAFPRPPRPRNR